MNDEKLHEDVALRRLDRLENGPEGLVAVDEQADLIAPRETPLGDLLEHAAITRFVALEQGVVRRHHRYVISIGFLVLVASLAETLEISFELVTTENPVERHGDERQGQHRHRPSPRRGGGARLHDDVHDRADREDFPTEKDQRPDDRLF